MGLVQKENRPSLDGTEKRVGPCIEDFYLVVPLSMAISVQHDPLWDQQNSSQSVGTQATHVSRPVPRAPFAGETEPAYCTARCSDRAGAFGDQSERSSDCKGRHHASGARGQSVWHRRIPL